MATIREKVELVFDGDESFARTMRAIDDLGRRANATWAIWSATWEPHDWSTF